METVILKRAEAEAWQAPPFQRPLRINQRVQEVANELATGKEISLEGIITLGRLVNSSTIYIVDGQHRIAGFKLSEAKEVIADIRLITFETMADMAKTFVLLNSSLVKMRPDDILRGLEDSTPALQLLRRECPFVGYDQIRRGDGASPTLGASVVIRAWAGSANETPSIGAKSAVALLQTMSIDDAQNLANFLKLAMAAWGRDSEYMRLWASLNLTMTMWLYRKMVMDKTRSNNRRYTRLTPDQFRQCLMSLSASRLYLDWLVGRSMCDRDRAPAFSRIRTIFPRRMATEGIKHFKLPTASWTTRAGGKKHEGL
jgi:hypothetical protein